MSKYTETYTTVTGLKGIFRTGTSKPTDSGVAGLKAGDVFINTTTKKISVYSGSQWADAQLTTTSTSTS